MLPRHLLSLTFSSFFILDDGRFRSEASELQSLSTLPDQVPGNTWSVKREALIAPIRMGGRKNPEKIESLIFGPDLADGRRTRLVVSGRQIVTGPGRWQISKNYKIVLWKMGGNP